MSSQASLVSVLRAFLATPWSIATVIRKQEAEWRSFNRYVQRHSLSPFEWEVLHAGEHPFRFAASLLLLFAALLVLTNVLPRDWVIPSWLKWQAAEQLTYFSTLWAVQATLAALVYPIVIAFVTVFLQRRPASETYVHLYVLDSGALAAGLSALLLVVVMAIQYVLIPVYGASALPKWVMLDSLWFVLNASLTAFFLFRTIDFLRPEVQLAVMRRYAVNIALPRDVRRLYSFQVLSQAHARGWVPAPSYADNNAPQGPKVLLSRFGFRKGAEQGKIHLREHSRLRSVRLWPLRAVVMSWMAAAQQWPKRKPRGPFKGEDSPLLEIAATPGTTYTESFAMAYVERGPSLQAWQRALLRSAFQFAPIARDRYGIRVKAVLEELEADARVAAGRSDVEQFERSYQALVSMHELLLGASLVEDDDGSTSSWALIPDIEAFAERPLYWEWADTYRSVILAAVNSLVTDSRPIRRLCHLVQHLEGDEVSASPVEIRENLLQLPPMLMYQLARWWTQRIEEGGEMQHGPARSVVLRAPLNHLYEEVVSTFVGGWENARTAVANARNESESFTWESAKATARLNMFHLQETGRMLLAAVSRGDRTAAEWFGDVLNNWFGSLRFEHQPFLLYGKTDFLTLSQISMDWPALASALALSEDPGVAPREDIATVQRGVLIAAIQNAWVDVRLVVMEILIAWIGGCKDGEPPLALEIAVGLLTGKHWRAGATVGEEVEPLSAEAYLKAKVRQFASEGQWRTGYIAMLDRFVERIKDMERPEMISSRVYSFSGADSVGSLQDAQLLLIAALSASDWQPGEVIRRQIDDWLVHQYDSVSVLRSRVDSWIKRLHQTAHLRPKSLSLLLRRLEGTYDAATAIGRAKNGIESLGQFVEARREEVLAAEPVDPDRLLEIGRFASAKGFSGTADSPMSLFSSISYVAAPLEDFTLTVSKARKGELTRVEMDQRAANEDDFWANSMANRVAVVVLSDVLRRCNMNEIFTPDAAAYWAALKSHADRIVSSGRHPVLLVDNATRPAWIWDWQHADHRGAAVRPRDLQVVHGEGRGDGYVCNFNNIAVYVAPLPLGESIILPKEAFGSVSFTAFQENRFVDVTVVERADTKLLVDLRLRFSRQVDVPEADALRLKYIAAAPPIHT
jgi:hypothetical protein